MVVAGGVEVENGELLCEGHRVSVLQPEKSDGCSTMCMCLKPLNCTLKIVKMIKFLHVYFTTI